jgi:Na+/H+ antiporter NhaC
MSKLNSPVNNLIRTADRQKYISKLEQNIGFKGVSRTPIHHKLIDKYEDITSKIPKRHIFIFLSLFITTLIILYYFKPKFVLKNINKNTPENKFKLNSNKNQNGQDSERIVSYWKLIFYSLIVSIVLFCVLYFTRNKIGYIGK